MRYVCIAPRDRGAMAYERPRHWDDVTMATAPTTLAMSDHGGAWPGISRGQARGEAWELSGPLLKCTSRASGPARERPRPLWARPGACLSKRKRTLWLQSTTPKSRATRGRATELLPTSKCPQPRTGSAPLHERGLKRQTRGKDTEDASADENHHHDER